jgi:hypothetical protein
MLAYARLTAAVILLGAALAAAADPAPLVPAPKPPANTARVRLPMLGKTATCAFKAQIPEQKGKTDKAADITLYVGNPGGGVTTTIQQWQAWGFVVPADRNAKLPELIVFGLQASPKPDKGRDAELKLTDIPVRLYEAPGGEKGGISNTLGIPLNLLSGNADKAAETRVYFDDRVIELSVPGARVKRPGTGPDRLADLQITDDDKLAPAYLPLNGYNLKYVSVNGLTQYTRPTKKVEQVAGGLSLGSGAAITMSVSMARGCDVELDKAADPTTGRVKELRLGPIAGPGVKGQKDFVLKNVTVAISGSEDHSYIWLGSAFVEQYFRDGVYACEAADGSWKLHGRVKPEYFDDQKNRGKKP